MMSFVVANSRLSNAFFNTSASSLFNLIATSFVFPNGRGRKVDGGYEVTGRWPLSSGVDNSDWNMLGFNVRERDDGPPIEQRFGLLHRSQYEIIDTWHAVGLAGTGSKDVAATKVFVPERRTSGVLALNGKPHPGSKVNPSPLFRLPMMALGPYVLSGVMLGCARGAYASTVFWVIGHYLNVAYGWRGTLLVFAIVNLGRFLAITPEEALRKTIARFTTRFEHVEESLHRQGRTMTDATLEEMDVLWEEAKRISG